MRSTRALLAAGTAALLAYPGLAAAAGVGHTANVKGAMAAAGCTLRHVKPLRPPGDNFHNAAPTLTAKMQWSTSPPSAGGHHSLWAVWGFYRQAINPRKVVHNLEHGGVVIWWGPDVPSSTVDRLEAFYRTSPNSMLGTPIPGLGNKVALTAWTGDPSTYYRDGNYGIGHVAVCPGFDQAAFAAFRAAYRNKGPEGIPKQYNAPGSGPSSG